MGDFLDRLLNPEKHQPKRKKKLSRRTIRTDKYDERTFERALEAMPDFDTERHRLCDTVDTGNGMTADVFQMLYKVEPENIDGDTIQPDYLINAVVRDELWKLNELLELRGLGTVGDEINASLGFITMRKDIESIFDRTRKEQELLEQLLKDQEQLLQAQQNAVPIEDALRDLEEQLAAALAAMEAAAQESDDDDEDGEEQPGGCSGMGIPTEGEGGEPVPGDSPAGGQPVPTQQEIDALHQQIAALRAALEQNLGEQRSLEEAIAAAKEAVEEGLESKQPQIRQALQHGLEEAIDNAKDIQALTTQWGMDPGVVQRMDAAERMRRAKQIQDSVKLRKLADIVGRFNRVAWAENRQHARNAREQISDIEMGNDLTRVLPDELALLRHPVLRREFRSRYSKKSLLQYKYDGTEKVGMGSILCMWDGSGSMQGDPEIGAKAVAIALMNIAHEQKRSFTGVQFSSRTELRQWDFNDPSDFTPEKVFDMAEFFFNGGTDFMAPLSLGLDILQKENRESGAVRGDIVFITDGYAAVQDDWLQEFKKEQERLGFHVFGVLIGGGNVTADPLHTICDGRVIEWRNFLEPEDFKMVFGNLNQPL